MLHSVCLISHEVFANNLIYQMRYIKAYIMYKPISCTYVHCLPPASDCDGDEDVDERKRERARETGNMRKRGERDIEE